MFKGSELRKLYEQYADLDGYKDVYQKEESAALKAYTLIASITRRMMENSLCINGWRNNKSFSVCTGYFYSNV